MGNPRAKFGTKEGSVMDVGKALSTMGYSNWSTLEPGMLNVIWYYKFRPFEATGIIFTPHIKMSYHIHIYNTSMVFYPGEQQYNEGYVAEQLNKRLLEKIQCIEAKRNKEKKQSMKKGMDTNGNGNKNFRGPKSLVDEERVTHEAYQVLLTEYHKRKAKRQETRQVGKKQQNENEVSEVLEDAFSHIRRK